MEFRQLEAFKLISELGSFSATANKLNVTQPTISGQISLLEREFGTPLFDRLPGKVVPTETGTALYAYAEQILALRDKSLTSLRSRKEMSGTITIAASSIPYLFILPIFTAQFSLKNPDVSFNLLSGDSASAADLVLSGKADLGMVGTIFHCEDLEYEPILEDELVMVTPKTEPYISWERCPVKMDEILSSPFIAREEGSGTWAEVENYLESQGYDGGALRIVARIENPDAIVKSVEQGMGITILSSLAASEYERKNEVLTFSLECKPVKRTLYLVRRKEVRLPAVTEAFARFASHESEAE